MPIPLFHVDAFTDRPFTGNPAAVCLLEQEKDDDWMQAIAAEMNLSETAFVRRLDDGFGLRWFTPTIEVDLCGHATLATAHALWKENVADRKQPICFHTKSGVLTVTYNGEFIELDFPSIPVEETTVPHGIGEALGVEPVFVANTKLDLLVEVESEEQVRSVQVDLQKIRQLPTRGVIVTGRSHDSKYDFVSRFFAPAAGIDEDPVCGSAHCALAPFWGKRFNKTEMIGYQASARGGVVKVRVADERVFLGGKAVTVMRGELTGVLQ